MLIQTVYKGIIRN